MFLKWKFDNCNLSAISKFCGISFAEYPFYESIRLFLPLPSAAKYQFSRIQLTVFYFEYDVGQHLVFAASDRSNKYAWEDLFKYQDVFRPQPSFWGVIHDAWMLVFMDIFMYNPGNTSQLSPNFYSLVSFKCVQYSITMEEDIQSNGIELCETMHYRARGWCLCRNFLCHATWWSHATIWHSQIIPSGRFRWLVEMVYKPWTKLCWCISKTR